MSIQFPLTLYASSYPSQIQDKLYRRSQQTTDPISYAEVRNILHHKKISVLNSSGSLFSSKFSNFNFVLAIPFLMGDVVGLASVVEGKEVNLCPGFAWDPLNERFVDVQSPCGNFINHAFFVSLAVGLSPFLGAGIGILVSNLRFRNAKNNYLESVKRFNLRLKSIKKSLSHPIEKNETISPKDAGRIFPLLNRDLLQRYEFRHLRKGYKSHPDLFLKYLRERLFSPLQLSYWHLILHVQSSDRGSLKEILTFNRDLFKGEPLLFQEVVQSIPEERLDDETGEILYDLLTQSVLDEIIVKKLDQEKIQNIILEVKNGAKLSKTINKHLENRVDFDPEFFRLVMKGELIVRDQNECYRFIGMAQKNGMVEVRKKLENILKRKFSEFIPDEQVRLQTLLEDIKKNQLDEFYLKVDNYLERTVSLPDIYSDVFATTYKFYYDNELVLTTTKFRNNLIKEVDNFITNSINYSLSRISALIKNIKLVFNYEQEIILKKQIKEKLTLYLHKNPKKLNDFINFAKENDDIKILKILGKIYKNNQEFFDFNISNPLEITY